MWHRYFPPHRMSAAHKIGPRFHRRRGHTARYETRDSSRYDKTRTAAAARTLFPRYWCRHWKFHKERRMDPKLQIGRAARTLFPRYWCRHWKFHKERRMDPKL